MTMFLKATDFIDQTAMYFKEKNLHLEDKVNTVGQIIYSSDSVMLKPLSDDKKIIISCIPSLMPENETYVHLYGNFMYYKDLKNMTLFNFEDETDLGGPFTVILNVTCWINLITQIAAERIEELLYHVNYNV